MPVLDCELWIQIENREVTIPKEIDKEANVITKTGALKNKIMHSFYKKPMADKCSLRSNSGIPEGTKVNTCSQEVIRRLKNTSRELEHSEIEKVLKDYMTELEHGGFILTWRTQV